MPRWSVLYVGTLVALAFLAAPDVNADGRRGRTRYYAPPVQDEPICRGPVRGLGTQWIGTEGAMDAAKKDWAERVRYDLGESYLDLGNAQDFEARCGRTSIGQVAGQVMYRCEVIARPCKGVFGKVEGQK
jgi:hypothetical protein